MIDLKTLVQAFLDADDEFTRARAEVYNANANGLIGSPFFMSQLEAEMRGVMHRAMYARDAAYAALRAAVRGEAS